LWCADGYHRTSSVGITNTDIDLIRPFKSFFLELFPKERLKLTVYLPIGAERIPAALDVAAQCFLSRKAKQVAYQFYVNSRPLLRRFKACKQNIGLYVFGACITPYLAGRFDGDGSVAHDFRSDCRIVYGGLAETERDRILVKNIGLHPKIYEYRTAKTFCLYISRYEAQQFLAMIYPYSMKLQKSVFAPRRDLAVTVA
jgi:hypothetical protein